MKAKNENDNQLIMGDQNNFLNNYMQPWWPSLPGDSAALGGAAALSQVIFLDPSRVLTLNSHAFMGHPTS